MYFQDRTDAGKKLSIALQKHKKDNSVVLAIPRGGLPVAREVAEELGAPIDVILSKKIGHPENSEFAIGAVSEEAAIVNPGFVVSMDFLNEQIEKLQAELARRRELYLQGISPLEIRDKIVIIVDDGAATGFTILSTVKLVQSLGAQKIIIGLPVASGSALERLKNHPAVAEVVCLHSPEDFVAVGNYYSNFEQLQDEDVVEILQESRSDN